MLLNPFADDAGFAGKASFPQLPPELSPIATPLFPALLQIFAMLIDRGGMIARPALRKAASTDPTANRLPAETAGACDFSLRGVLPDPLHHGFIARPAALSVLLLHALFAR